jgi:NAD(P)-dependent dehydrogenase (short-subunit alcohol dehydrogenase family)
MMLKNKNAVIYGAGGAIGRAVARAFAKEGAKVFLSGRNLASVAATAKEFVAPVGTAEAAQVDALETFGQIPIRRSVYGRTKHAKSRR